MKIRNYAAAVLGCFALMSANVSYAKSELISLSCQPLWPTSSTPNTDLLYYVTTVGRGGAGLLQVTLTAGALPPGVTVTFSPSVLRFTGNQLTLQSSTMTVHCQEPMPLDCYSFALTGTSQHETLTVTNEVMFTPAYIETRRATLYLDNLGDPALRLRGLGATAKTYQIEISTDLSNPVWTPLGTTTADGNGRFTFFTSQAAATQTRFYRAVELP